MKKLALLILVPLLLIPLTGCEGYYSQEYLDESIARAEDIAYERAYEKGLLDGYETGYDEGYSWGETFAYDHGYEKGYDEGYEAGYNDGENREQQRSYESGYESGCDECYKIGFLDGKLASTSTIDVTEPTSDLFLEIISVTSPVYRGNYATLAAMTAPYTLCGIDVYYKSGKSEAWGLYPHKSDDDGYISWRWLVGGNTTPGHWKIVVTAYDLDNWLSDWPFAQDTVYFEVK